MAELAEAIKHLKTGKRAGKDCIPNEFWKHLTGKGLEALLDLFQSCWTHGKSPDSSSLKVGEPLHKLPVVSEDKCHICL